MKTIVLAKKSHRIFAAFIDLLLVIASAFGLFIGIVFPLTINVSKYSQYNEKVFEEYASSGLFLVDEENKKCIELSFYSSSYSDLNLLSNITLSFNGKEFKHINTLERLYKFYTDESKIKHFLEHEIYNLESFKKEILGIDNPNSNSCITSFSDIDYKITSSDESTSVGYIIEKVSAITKGISNSKVIKSLLEARDRIMLSELLYLIPLLVLTSFIFIFLIPILSKGNKTIGKRIFHLIVLSDDGYKYKKSKMIVRWISYTILELLFGLITLGSGLLISYTMFLFKKKRRCLHDVIAKSVVADERQSIYFDSKEEEQYFINKKKVGIYA